MKNLFFIAVFLLSALSMNAQKELAVEGQYPGDDRALNVFTTAVEKQSNDGTSALRTTWVANRPCDNWFISVGAGMGGMISKGHANASKPWNWFEDGQKGQSYWHPAANVSIGKWFSPVWGLRLSGVYGSVQGFDKGSTVAYSNVDDYVGGTVDYLLNLKNFFTSYNPKAFFNPVLYAGMGVIYTPEAGNQAGFYNIAEKAGLQLNFRLCDSWDLFLDGQALLVPKNFDRSNNATFLNSDVLTNASIGFTYRINFRHFIKAPLYDPREIDALNKEINDLRNRPVPVCPPVVVCPDPVPAVETKATKEELDPVFFLINSSAVRDNQLVNVAKAAEYLINNPGSKLELASYADRSTGTPSHNMRLSKNRSESVANVLVKRFGIDKSRLVLKHYGDTVQPFAENDWNRVTIFILP